MTVILIWLIFSYLVVGCVVALCTGIMFQFHRRWILPATIVLWPFFFLMLIAFVVVWITFGADE